MEHCGDKIPDSCADKCVEETDTNPSSRDQQDLQHLAPPLEVLAHHEDGGVEDHGHPHPDDEAVADEYLVPLTSEGGKETSEGGDHT